MRHFTLFRLLSLTALCCTAPAFAQTGQLASGFTGLCLQVNGAVASGSRLQTGACTANNPKQIFTRTAAGELRINGNLCVDAYGGGKQAAEVGLWTCQGSLNERWAPNNGMLITENGFCLAVDAGNRNPGTRIIVYSCYPNDPSQRWTGPTNVTTAPAPVVTPPPPPPVAAPPSAPAFDTGMLSAACQMVFGNACSADDTAAVRNSAPANWATRETMMAVLRLRIVNSASIRDTAIGRAAELTYGANAQLCTEAWTFLRSTFTTNANNQPGSAWNGVNQLYYAANGNPPMLTSVVNARCGAVAPKLPGTAFDASIARAACQTMFGRDCSSDENAQIGSRVGGNNRDAMQAFLRDMIAASQPYKDTIIRAAFAAGVPGKALCTEEYNDLMARFASNPQPGITWNGFSGLYYAAGGQPPLVQARNSMCVAPVTNINSTTMSMIVSSYSSDFGRAPRQDETTYWAGVKASDPRVASRAAFLQNDRDFLRTNAAERDAVIRLSYQRTFQRDPTADEFTHWRGVLAGNGTTFDELVKANRDYLAAHPVMTLADRRTMLNQSYSSAFGRVMTPDEDRYWSSLPTTDARIASLQTLIANHRQTLRTDTAERTNTVTRSYNQPSTFKRVPTAAELSYWVGVVQQQGNTFDELVAAHRDYISKNPAVLTPPPTPTAGFIPGCFGAVGAMCTGFPRVDSGQDTRVGFQVGPVRFDTYFGCEPAIDGVRKCYVVPGSIKHDNCCNINPKGQMCGGFDTLRNQGCNDEWAQAMKDALNARGWEAYFDVSKPDDMTPVASSRYPASRYQNGGREAISSSLLCAPAGTNISWENGPGFCCSGKFRPISWWMPETDVAAAGTALGTVLGGPGAGSAVGGVLGGAQGALNMTVKLGGQWGVCAAANELFSVEAPQTQRWSGPAPVGTSRPLTPLTPAEVAKFKSGQK